MWSQATGKDFLLWLSGDACQRKLRHKYYQVLKQQVRCLSGRELKSLNLNQIGAILGDGDSSLHFT